MTISKKPKNYENTVASIIQKGGSVAGEKNSIEEKEERKKILLTCPQELVDILDEHLSKKIVNKNRTNFILDAIWEKLNRERQNI